MCVSDDRQASFTTKCPQLGEGIAVQNAYSRALRNIAEFEYVTGWRIDTEVLPLLWRQVDFVAGEVRIDDPRSRRTSKPGCFILPRIFDAPWRLSGS
jgi:hypothetical protein